MGTGQTGPVIGACIGEYRFHSKAANGEIVAQSQGYDTRDGALKGIDAVKRAAAEAPFQS